MMKKFSFVLLICVSFLIMACRGTGNINKAYEMAKSEKPASEVLNELVSYDIDYDKLTPEDYAKISYAVLYGTTTSMKEEDFKEKVDEKKVKDFMKKTQEAVQKLTPEEQKEVVSKTVELMNKSE